ncbi:MAG: general secretion pathway protein GspD [Planctomycetes bacterium]|nr:general secretion pathway protein GspD [Planctomycetota bacterium]
MKATAPWLAGLAALSVTLLASPDRAEAQVRPTGAAVWAMGQTGVGGLLPFSRAPADEPRAVDPFAAQRREQAFDRLTNTQREQAATYLEKGRTAVARGDSVAGLHWYRKAKAVGAEFAPGEYSPHQLAEALLRAGVSPQELAATPQPQAGPTLTPDEAAAADRNTLPALLEGQPIEGRENPFGGAAVTNPYLIRTDDGSLLGVQTTPAPTAAAAEPQVGEFGGEMRRLPKPKETADANSTTSRDDAKASTLRLVAQARAALDGGDLNMAHRLASQARDIRVPNSAFTAGETPPWALLMEIESEMTRRGMGVMPAAAFAVEESGESAAPRVFPVQQSVYDPQNDTTRTVPANTQAQVAPPLNPSPPTPRAAPPAPLAGNRGGPGYELYESGLKALENQDREQALKHFRDAWKHEATLDPLTRQRLQDHLGRAIAPAPAPGEPAPLQEMDAEEQRTLQRLSREINVETREAEALMEADPLAGFERMKKVRERVAASPLSPGPRRQLLAMVDRTLGKMEAYIDANRANIELKAENKAILAEIDRERAMKLASQERLAELVEEFNKLMDQERYAEAEVIALQAREIAPDEAVVSMMIWKSRFVKAYESKLALRDERAAGFDGALTAVEASSVPFDDRYPIQFGDARQWSELSQSRRQWLQEQGRRLNPAEIKIQDVLKEPVDVRFNNQPLAEVMDILSAAVGVNFHLNQEGMRAEGITSDVPINLQLREPVSLRSALTLILEPLHLSYVIRNEVLEITSETVRRSDVAPKVYNVGDLVIPIPNFAPSYNMGLPAAIRNAYGSTPYGQPFGGSGMAPLTVMAQNDQQPGNINPLALAQMGPTGSIPSSGRGQNPLGFGPGGLGGGSQPDFDSLIELITTTIAPESWDEVGGPGAIHQHGGNLSLVISQTQEIHEQIADLLEQLRRLQDLQVTIEVRFITINDNFFERIGIDFDFDIDDNSIFSQQGIIPDDDGPSLTVGLDPTGQVTTDGDLSFTQASFASAIPQFGGFDPATAANFGFAILSDIEVFFLLQAAQGDSRTNVLQAPKVTLFNGQQATVSDTTQRPFVTSIVPVVGDFAAAHAPVVVVLSEGTSLSVQAVVSNDRRFVRLTLVPFFSQIGNVEEFTFNGKTTRVSGDQDNDPNTDEDDIVTIEEGTTVQLPTFSFTTVSTTVSVPDGGTVLLGGIKRLQEGRNERGLPLLSKVPYVSRLFKNVGIGRSTQSLMMMVTPRIIIQEEEEAKLGIETP